MGESGKSVSYKADMMMAWIMWSEFGFNKEMILVGVTGLLIWGMGIKEKSKMSSIFWTVWILLMELDMTSRQRDRGESEIQNPKLKCLIKIRSSDEN